MEEKVPKLKAASQEERHQKWKEHFTNIVENPLETIDKPTKEIINSQLDIKCGSLWRKNLNSTEKNFKKNTPWSMADERI